MRRFLLLSFLTLETLSAQQPQRPFMELSFIVTGKDNTPVADMKQDEITIKDNNKTQEILAFGKSGAPAHQVVLLDALDTTYSDTPQNRVEILKILNEFSKFENVTFLALMPDLRFLSGPGPSDPDLLRKFAKQGFDPAKPEAFNWVFTDPTALGGIFSPAGVTDRVRYETWIKRLQAIASNFHGRPGRKNLYWISQDTPLVIGETGAGYLEQAAGQGADEVNSGGAKKGEADIANERADLFQAYARDINQTARMVANANLAVYPIDARFLSRTPTAVSDRNKMNDLAKATGGTAFTSRQDVANCVREALADSGTVYIARYAIADLKPDGKFHQVKIESKRKDVKIKARQGYYAPQGR